MVLPLRSLTNISSFNVHNNPRRLVDEESEAQLSDLPNGRARIRPGQEWMQSQGVLNH